MVLKRGTCLKRMWRVTASYSVEIHVDSERITNTRGLLICGFFKRDHRSDRYTLMVPNQGIQQNGEFVNNNRPYCCTAPLMHWHSDFMIITVMSTDRSPQTVDPSSQAGQWNGSHRVNMSWDGITSRGIHSRLSPPTDAPTGGGGGDLTFENYVLNFEFCGWIRDSNISTDTPTI